MSIPTQKLTNAILSGIDSLMKEQEKDGSYISLTAPELSLSKRVSNYHSVFSTSLILDALQSLREIPELKEIKNKSVHFLLSQKSSFWSFNYWVRDSQEAKLFPYPDDLDDTFCALSALYNTDPSLINASALAKIVAVLTTSEQKAGGPYYTWIVPKKAKKKWKDIDPVVNSNIGYFLDLQKIDLPNITRFIETRIQTKQLISPYYPSIYPVIYFISRFYKGKKIEVLKKVLFSHQKKNGSWGNSLYTALAITSLLNMGEPTKKLTKSINYLLSMQQKNGAWEPYAFCIDPTINKEVFYSGSSALTTAFCLESIKKYLLATTREYESKQIARELYRNQLLYKETLRFVAKRFAIVSVECKKETIRRLNPMLNKDIKKEIVLLPYFFKNILHTNAKKIPLHQIKLLCAANLLGWLAYTLYDNFLDEEGETKTLSLANIALRELTIIYHSFLPKNKEFQSLFHHIMDELEYANMWEVTHCRVKIKKGNILLANYRLPSFFKYKQLAAKSFGHALGPIALLFSLGFSRSSPELENIMIFFRSYLIARQLNDDAHDWRDDIKNGHINPVTVLLLKKYKLLGNNLDDTDLPTLIKELEKIFWYHSIDQLSSLIFEHLRQAREALRAVSVIVFPERFEHILQPIESATHQAVKESKDAIAFLQSYKEP